MLALNSNKTLKVAIVGGSNSVMRYGYSHYFQKYINSRTGADVELASFSLGGVTSLYGLIQNCRHEIAKNHDLILFEYCVNDRSACYQKKISQEIAGMALEGFIRQSKTMNPMCNIAILIFGTNRPKYYNFCCNVSAVYESVARRYNIPVINLTEILLAGKGINFIKGLYGKDDPNHYSRPEGVEVVGKTIAEQILQSKLLENKKAESERYYRVYAENLQDLKFVSNFDSYVENHNAKKTIFKNSLFHETIYTFDANSPLKFELKGQLLSLLIKSDWYSGLLKIEFEDIEFITSFFSIYVKNAEKSNITLLNLPYNKIANRQEFKQLSISVCSNYIDKHHLDFNKVSPESNPDEWKLNLIGIAYTGELKSLV